VPEAPASMSWREIDQRLRGLAARRAALDAEEAFWLLAAKRTGVHRRLGHASMVDYCRHVLGYEPRTTLERLRVAEALECLPAMRDALAHGRMSYSAIRELTRNATPSTEVAWLEAAAGKTVREIEELVAGHKPGNHPDDDADPDLAPRILRLELSAETYALFLQARRAVEDETGERLSDDEVMRALCRGQLAGSAQGGTDCDDDDRDDSPDGRAPHQIALTTCVQCRRVWQDGGGQVIEVPPEVLARVRCDAQEIGHVDGDAPKRATQTIPPAIRRQVLRRDHRRCSVPGCGSSRWVDLHHIRARTDGGDHEPSNITTTCTGHHAAVHQGRLIITGRAPHDLRFTHGDGRPYGAPPPPPSSRSSTEEDDVIADAESALRNLGFSVTHAR